MTDQGSQPEKNKNLEKRRETRVSTRGLARSNVGSNAGSIDPQDDASLVSVFPFYTDLTAAQQQEVRRQARALHWPAGRILLEEGVICQHISWIVTGRIRVYKLSPDGREVTLYRIHGGDTCLISASCIMNSRGFPAVAETETDTHVLSIPAALFRSLLQTSSTLQEYVLSRSLERLTSVVGVIDSMLFTRRSTAVAAFLLQRITETGHPDVTITHQGLAVELGTAREVVSRTLRDLQNDGIVRLSRGRIHVVDQSALAALAEK